MSLHLCVNGSLYCVHIYVWSCSQLYISRNRDWDAEHIRIFFSSSLLIVVCGWEFENVLDAACYIWDITSNVCYSPQSCMLHLDLPQCSDTCFSQPPHLLLSLCDTLKLFLVAQTPPSDKTSSYIGVNQNLQPIACISTVSITQCIYFLISVSVSNSWASAGLLIYYRWVWTPQDAFLRKTLL